MLSTRKQRASAPVITAKHSDTTPDKRYEENFSIFMTFYVFRISAVFKDLLELYGKEVPRARSQAKSYEFQPQPRWTFEVK